MVEGKQVHSESSTKMLEKNHFLTNVVYFAETRRRGLKMERHIKSTDGELNMIN